LADLIQCPKCGLRQTARHAYCSRCEYAFTGSPDEYVRDDVSSPTGTPTPPTPTGSSPSPSYGESSFEGRAGRRGSLGERETPRTDSVRAVPDGDRLVRDRGSLSRRLSTPASPVPQRVDEDDELPNAPSWTMPVRQSAAFRLPEQVKQAFEEEPPDEQFRPSLRGQEPDTGREYLVRGRPQGELYASERSLPPEDPLLADLVAGRVSKNPKVTDEFALPGEWDHSIRSTNPDLLSPSAPQMSHPGRRVVAPSTPGRRATGSRLEGRSRSQSGVRTTLSGRTDPGTRLPGVRPVTQPGVRPPTNPAARIPTSPRVRPRTNPGFSAADVGMTDTSRKPPRSAVRSLPNAGIPAPTPIPDASFHGFEEQHFATPPTPPEPPAGTGARAPGVPRRPPPRTTPGSTLPEADPRRPLTGKEVGAAFALVIAAAFAVLGIVNGLAVSKARSAIRETLNEGIGPDGPIADLPRSLRQTLDGLDVRDQIEATHTHIDGEDNTYRIGVELKSPVAFYPVRWKAMREGPFDVEARIRTLDVYVEGGWTLDSTARARLDRYGTEREEKLRRERIEARETQRMLIVGEPGTSPDAVPTPGEASAPDADAPDVEPDARDGAAPDPEAPSESPNP
jgi:hypothetical protein